MNAADAEPRRGGDQVIPRPPNAQPGKPAPWAVLPPEDLRLPLEVVRSRLAAWRNEAVITVVPRDMPTRAAAVLVPLFESAGEARVILTKRPETMPSHRGEIAFPGGKHDDLTDADLVATALREAAEEIGLDPAAVAEVIELATISTVASAFTITPYAGFLAGPPELDPHPYEVTAVFDVALSELLAPETFREEVWTGLNGSELRVHFYELPGETVWGATARILTALLTAVTRGVTG